LALLVILYGVIGFWEIFGLAPHRTLARLFYLCSRRSRQSFNALCDHEGIADMNYISKKSETDLRYIPRLKPALFTFFAGAGFLDLGFEKSGFDVVFANEFHGPFLSAYKYARDNLKIQRPMFGYLKDDIQVLLNGEEANALQKNVNRARASHGLVGFVGGPPCPDFSVGGKNKGREGKNGVLSQVYVDLICQQKPDFFIFENVKGLWRTKVHRAFYDELKLKLKTAGYVLSERLINAIEYGAPQDRDRIILVGFLEKSFEGISEIEFPWFTQTKFDRSILNKENWPSVDQFVENQASLKPSNVQAELTVQHWFEKNSVNTHPNSSDCFTPRAALPKFKVIDEGDDSKKCFKRLHRWRYSPTAAYGNNEVHLHPYQARRISVAEALALQSLPKEFLMPPSMTLTDKFKAIGNGVPFEAAKGLATSVMQFLEQVH
jgi:DNA (cytosine-5)-methyltransferase 1